MQPSKKWPMTVFSTVGKLTINSTTSFRVPEGIHQAKLVRVTDQNDKARLLFEITQWQFPMLMPESKPTTYLAGRTYPDSLEPRSPLRAALNSWGKYDPQYHHWGAVPFCDLLIGQLAELQVKHFRQYGADWPHCEIENLFPVGTHPPTLDEANQLLVQPNN